MLNLRRAYINPSADLRENPRIEFHFPVAIIGVESKASVVDFSLGGFFIETDSPAKLATGQKVNLALKLPGEKNGIMVKAEVVYKEETGFGCKLCDPTPETNQVLERCFGLFSCTLPLD